MKKTFIVAALMCATVAMAGDWRDGPQPRRGQHHNNYQGNRHNGAEWVVPALIGGAIVYGITESQRAPVYVQPPPQPVYIQPSTVYVQPPVYVPPTIPEYKERIMWDVTCTCYIKVLVPVQ